MAGKPRATVQALPSNLEAEEAVLGCLLGWPEVASENVGKLGSTDFLTVKNAVVFEAIRSLVNDGTLPDVISVANRLESMGKTEDAGGRVRLGDLATKIVTDAGFDHYVAIVKDKATRRALMSATARIEELAHDEARDIRDVATEAQKILDGTRLQATMGGVAVFAPVIEADGTTLRADWCPPGIRAMATKLQSHKSDGSVTGFVRFTGTMPGIPARLTSGQLNFAAVQTRATWENRLSKVAALPDGMWATILEQLSESVIEYVETGEPVQQVDSEVDPKELEYLLFPILLRNEPTVIYGDIGVNKSYLAALLTYILMTGQENYRLEVRHKIQSPLYLDWESSVGSFARRWAKLRRGMNLPPAKASYRRCALPLVQDSEQVKELIRRNGHDFIIIDSLGLAAGGDLNNPQPANDFYKALRSLNVTSLVIAHQAKNTTGKTSIFGSQFFGAAPRSIWEVRRDQDEGADVARVGLYHAKANEGRREPPIGFKFTFGGNFTRVEPDSADTIQAADDRAPIKQRIVDALKQDGKMTYQQLSVAIGIPEHTIRTIMTRLMTTGEVRKLSTGSDGRARFGLGTLDEFHG